MTKWILPLFSALTIASTGCTDGSKVNATQIGRGGALSQSAKRNRYKPDLVVTALTFTPASPKTGELVTLTATVKNSGTSATPQGTTLGVGFINSQGQSLGFSDTHTTSLAAGATVQLVSNQKWTAVVGTHTMTAIVDDINRIVESNESNNRLSAAVTVVADEPTVPLVPDLVVTGFSHTPSAPQAGEAVRFTATVKNVGTGATPGGVIIGVGFRDSSGSNLAFSDTYSTSLPAGASVNLTSNQTWSATAGTHSLTADVDDINRIVESNESNNLSLLSLVVGSVSPTPTPTPTPSPTNAKPAFRFIDSIGVNTHFAFTGTPYYSKYAQVKARLLELGVKYIRDGSGSASGYKAGTKSSIIWNELASLGVKLNIISRTNWTTTDIIDVLNANKSAIIAVEGQNEADIFLNSDWTGVRALQQRLWTTIRNNPAFSTMPIIGPSVGQPSRFQYIGDLSAYADFGNIHSYPGGKRPLINLEVPHMSEARKVTGDKPIMATETGYHTAVQTSSGHLPISERGMGKYMPRLFFDYFNKGVVRTFQYQFFDHIAPSSTDPEANFGLVRSDMSVRPAFTSMKNTIAILKDSTANIPGGTLSFTLGGNTTNVRSTLLQKSDGTFYLAMWQDLSVWDTNARRDIVNADAAISITFSAPKNVALYKPSVGAGIQSSYSSSVVNVNVPDEVIILQIKP